MSTEPIDEPDELLLGLMAQYDEALATDAPTVAVDESAIESDALMAAEWQGTKRCLELLDRARRQGIPAPPVATVAQQQLGRFQIERELGRGGLGIVYLAHDPQLGRKVALKIPRFEALLDDNLRQRFFREAEAAARLNHPHLVTLHEVGQDGSICYLASEYCPGPTLAQWLKAQSGPVPIRQATKIVLALAEAIEHAHNRGVLHRDIKPSNVLLAAPTEEAPLENLSPKLTDFGMAKLLEQDGGNRTRTGAIIGTLAYMAPEQAEGKVDELDVRADVYALGAILYELLTGVAPYAGQTDVDTLRQLILSEPAMPRALRPDVPRDLEAIVLRCLAKRPAGRYATSHELVADLRRFLAGEPTKARPLGAIEQSWKWSRRRPLLASLLGVGGAAAMLLICGAWYHTQKLDAALAISESRRLEADSSRSEMQRHVYSSDIRLAELALHGLRADQCNDILWRLIPAPTEPDLREFAWGHLWAQTHSAQHTLAGHHGPLFAVAYSPNGRWLVTGGADGILRMWDAKTGQLVDQRSHHMSDINAIDFSQQGDQLASVGDGGQLILWDVTDQLRIRQQISLGKMDLLAVQFLPDGKRVAVGGGDHLLQIVRAADATLERELRGHTDDILALALCDGGRRLASGGHDGKLLLWDLEAPEATAPEEPFGSFDIPVRALATSPDDRFLAVGTSEWLGVLRFSDQDRVARHTSSDDFSSVAFSNDGKSLVSANHDSACRIWNWTSASERPRELVGHSGRLHDVAMSPDQRQFASVGADGYLRLWSLDVTDRAMLNGPRPLLRSDAVVSPNGCWAVTESERSSEFLVHQWRDNRWHTVDRLARPKPWSETEFDISNDGQWVVQRRETNVYCWRRGVSDGWTHVGKHENLVDRLAIVPGKDILVTLFKCTLQAWQLSSSSLLWQVEMKTNNPAARLHATAELLCCAAGSVVSVHRVDSGDVVFYKNVPSGEFNDAVISPDGREVLAASTDRAIHRWTLSDGQELDRWVGHDDAVLALAVHPSGKTVASVDQRRVLKLWHSITGLPLLTSSIDLSRPRLNFADDGERLLICGRTEQAGLNVVTLFSHLPMRRTSNPAVSAPAR